MAKDISGGNNRQNFLNGKRSLASTPNVNNSSVSYITVSKELSIRLSCQRQLQCDTSRKKDYKMCICGTHTVSWKEATWGTNCWQISVENSDGRINNAVSRRLMQFICKSICFFAINKLKTTINFPLVDASKPRLCPFPSFIITKV